MKSPAKKTSRQTSTDPMPGAKLIETMPEPSAWFQLSKIDRDGSHSEDLEVSRPTFISLLQRLASMRPSPPRWLEDCPLPAFQLAVVNEKFIRITRREFDALKVTACCA